MIRFGREICSHLETAERREWLVTNGMGGYAMGTVAGLLTRRYHGLLVAALQPPLGRTLLLAKLDEDVKYDGRQFALYANRWADGALEDEGLQHVEQFRLAGTTPVWTYAPGDALLEKRVWMEPGANTTYVQYRFERGSGPLELYAKAIVNYRDYHHTTILNEWQPQIARVENGLRVTMYEGARPLTLLCTPGEAWPEFNWYEDYFLGAEEARGQNDVVEDHVHAGVLGATLQPGETFTIVASAEPRAANDDRILDVAAAWRRRADHERELLHRAAHVSPPAPAQLVLAADQFVVRRGTTPAGGDDDERDDSAGATILAGYPWFSDWGRDTMISLPGLALGTGRAPLAARILRTYATFVEEGLLPNRFPDEGQTPERNSVDAGLWYFDALQATLAHVGGDEALCRELYPALRAIIEGYRQGTRHNIHVDEADGLLYAGEAGVQLTWMDAKVDDWVVTPRTGKAVEVNALWYNALKVIGGVARAIGEDPEPYEAMADEARRAFARFWNAERNACYDVLDGPEGDDASLRPNQILAVALPHSALEAWQQKAIVDICARRLVTSFGLRSLAPDEEGYVGRYEGDQKQRDGAYHQGTVWAWLMGPFVRAHVRVYGDRRAARRYLAPLMQHLVDHGVGSVSEIFDGDAPFFPRGCPAQAWSVGELIRAWQETA